MSALLRARVSAFLAGVAVAGVVGVYQLRGDVAEGHARLAEQVGPGRHGRRKARSRRRARGALPRARGEQVAPRGEARGARLGCGHRGQHQISW